MGKKKERQRITAILERHMHDLKTDRQFGYWGVPHKPSDAERRGRVAMLEAIIAEIEGTKKRKGLTMSDGEAYEGWAILELMGHRRIGGYVKQVEQYGTAMVRIDVPGEDGDDATQFYSGGSLYCVTPTTEEIARGLAVSNRPAPVNTWDLPKQRALPEPSRLPPDPEEADDGPGWCPDCDRSGDECACYDDMADDDA